MEKTKTQLRLDSNGADYWIQKGTQHVLWFNTGDAWYEVDIDTDAFAAASWFKISTIDTTEERTLAHIRVKLAEGWEQIR
jgi:hypothetical protein